MNLYHQYLALLQMFFHRKEKRTPHAEKPQTISPISEKELFREPA